MQLAFLSELEEIVQLKRLNPMLMSGIVHQYQEGKYQAVIDAISQYVEETKSIDVYILFMGYAADLFLRSKSLTDIHTCISAYDQQLNTLSGRLSPLERFDTTLLSAIDIFVQMLNMKITAEIKQLKFFDVDALVVSYESLLDTVQSLTSVQLDLARRKSVLITNKTIKELQLAIKRMLDKEQQHEAVASVVEQPNESTVKQSPQKQVKHRYVDEFASVKWYKFVKKVLILQSMINAKRFFEGAIIYEDIQKELTDFDPKDYFPGLFFPLYKSIAPNARTIYKHIEQNSNSLEWHIAKKLYQSDPMRFLRDLPSMAENNYHDEQFQQGDYTKRAQNEEQKLIEDVNILSESEDICFKEDIIDDKEESLVDDNEINHLLEEIEGVWDQAGLSKE
ncbi:type VI secretion system protein IglI family protein [Cysteiniphilum halobium]|uniref:type VI secretion system protein IglI family protein n=1 Tax=Cysteiniphilum halobium TaxID=2219059 RepID=UPI000E64ED89|nr:type VI secretion system protein IglI family protein [Cysteiniphilum halobium]